MQKNLTGNLKKFRRRKRKINYLSFFTPFKTESKDDNNKNNNNATQYSLNKIINVHRDRNVSFLVRYFPHNGWKFAKQLKLPVKMTFYFPGVVERFQSGCLSFYDGATKLAFYDLSPRFLIVDWK